MYCKDYRKKIVESRDLEERKDRQLCILAYKHAYLKSNKNSRDEETHRTRLRRQRDRILYKGGFRRLQDKTQVISATTIGDHRTRLTHSLEVEQIAISIADALSLNTDLVAAIALGHDIGHTPFGHEVERVLDRELKVEGGFSHSLQSARYLDVIKELNLADVIIEGILKHDTDFYFNDINKYKQYNYEKYINDKDNGKMPSTLEAQIVYWADKLAYITHDFQDFYETEIYQKAIKHNGHNLKRELSELLSNITKKKLGYDLVGFDNSNLIRALIKNLIYTSFENMKAIEKSMDDIPDEINRDDIDEIDRTSIKIKDIITRNTNKNFQNESKKYKDNGKCLDKKEKKKCYMASLIIGFDKEYLEYYLALRQILDRYYICSPEVKRFDGKAGKIAKYLFDLFKENYRMLPRGIIDKIDIHPEDKNLIIADFIASMTDSYAQSVYKDINAIGDYYKY
ncbi:MAG: dNTP triphosphohydrolase [Peptostreptococcaceae bacterium]|jgi:dGTPase|nr:dNTP triphosphohydrolase [Peptostreptococcaceae bacterium]